MSHFFTTLIRIAMITLGGVVLFRHGAGEGLAGVILVVLCAALIGVPLYFWIPGDFDKAKDKASEVYKEFKK